MANPDEGSRELEDHDDLCGKSNDDHDVVVLTSLPCSLYEEDFL